MVPYKIFAINPGSTSTKIALFEGNQPVFSSNVAHDAEVLKQYREISDQFDYRKETILEEVEKAGVSLEGVDAFSARGGGLVSVEGGVYVVNDKLLEHARAGFSVKHPAMLGAQLADAFSKTYGGNAYVVNPPDVDEFSDLARVTGWKGVYRESRIHALNQKAVAKRYAKEAGKPYESLRLVVVHMGGGVSVGAHEDGKVVDVFSAFDGDGAFSPERAGGVPCAALVKMCFSGKYTEKEISAKLIGKGGLNSYLGTNDMREVTKRANEGDAKAAEVKQAFLLQVAKDIGAMACVLNGKVDQIVITGGIAYGEDVVAKLKERCGWIAPVTVYPGEDELLALAQGALRVMNGEEQVKQY